MNEENPVDQDTDDLDVFSSEFFGQKKEQPEAATPEDDEDDPVDESDALEQNNDTQDGEDTSDPEDEPEDEPEPEKPAKPKSRFQERIDELTSKAREAERERDAVIARLEKLEQNGKPEPAPKVEEKAGPAPDDVNEDGTDKYPLGEFDPNYIRDLTRHTLETERQAIKDQEKQAEAQRELDTQKAALQADWQEKLGPAQERYPDFIEKGESLISVFDGIDQAYGEYLTSTLMSLEFGPDVLYYLANNVDEATKIVNSGPTKATIALGRLEAKFLAADEEKQKARPKVSQAPVPPPRNKGSAVAVVEVPDDTDDLDAFAAKLFKKTKRR